MTTIALAMIAGGDDPVDDGLEHAIDSARAYVDEVCVWANGPRTSAVIDAVARLNSRDSAPVRAEVGVWEDDFSAARNASYAMAESDWILVLDCNDELVGGERLREVVRSDEKKVEPLRLGDLGDGVESAGGLDLDEDGGRFVRLEDPVVERDGAVAVRPRPQADTAVKSRFSVILVPSFRNASDSRRIRRVASFRSVFSRLMFSRSMYQGSFTGSVT